MLKKIFAVFLISLVFLTGCSENDSKKEYKFNEAFEFDDLELTISNDISFTILDNEFSDNNGKDVVRVPVTVKNIGKENNKINMFYIKYFGINGTEIDDASTYFDEDSIEFAGDLQPGASYTKYFYFIYEGDGTYTINLDNWSTKIDFKLDIKK